MTTQHAQLWKVGELAKRTGLTVRTLHHYDQIGLLRPSARTESMHASGHRLYTAADVARLQQIQSLKLLGFALDDIREYLSRSDYDPRRVVRLHLSRVRGQVAELQKLAEKLTVLADALDKAEVVSADEFLTTIEEMTMIEKLYTPEQMKQFEEVAKAVGPDEIQAVQDGWVALMAEVRANTHLDPAGPEAQELGRRWEELTERTMRGYQAFPDVKQAIADNYKAGKFEGFTLAPQAADMAFIERVKAAKKADNPA
jgi:MerR family transcriptional regulator, thiopeptide resistance regulator